MIWKVLSGVIMNINYLHMDFQIVGYIEKEIHFVLICKSLISLSTKYKNVYMGKNNSSHYGPIK